MFRPYMGGPSSGCDINYRASIQDVWGVFEGVADWPEVGGEETSLFQYWVP
jgi:hypothetical protein